jgi:hypothetical protein
MSVTRGAVALFVVKEIEEATLPYVGSIHMKNLVSISINFDVLE